MMTDVTLAKETLLFVQSLALGAGLSVLYDMLRILRRETRHRAAVISLEDVLYFLLCAVITFGFILRDNSGQIRGYILVGELIGWVIWHMTIGEAAVGICVWIFERLKRIIGFWMSILLAPIVWIGKILCRLVQRARAGACRILKKVVQKEKYNLKRKRMMLYNLGSRFRNTRM